MDPASARSVAPAAPAAPAAPVAPAPAVAELTARWATHLETHLREERGLPSVPWSRPWVASVIGAVAVLGLLLVTMTVVGALL